MSDRRASDRYSRQIIMPEIGEVGQKMLGASTAVIVGVGALGSVQAELLARAGIGKLVLIDFDFVEVNNLARQALYTTADVKEPKVEAAKRRIEAINTEVVVEAILDNLEEKNLAILNQADIVLDGTDNMETRFLMNAYCSKKGLPAIYTSAVMDRGSVIVVKKDTPCYECVFGGKDSQDSCCSNGVLNGTTHLAATLAATEALKFLIGQPTMKGMFSFSLFASRFDVFSTKKRPDCPVCSAQRDSQRS